MDRVGSDLSLEDEIEEVIRQDGVDRAEAIVIVALRHGEVFGDGDLVAIRPLTEELRERAGLTHTFDQVMEAQRARRGGTVAAPPNGANPDGTDRG